MAVKDFLKEWKPKNLKKMDKDEITATLYEFLPDIVSFYVKKGHTRSDEVKDIFARMNDKKFAKALRRIVKTPEHSPVDLAVATMVYDFMQTNHQELDDDLAETYSKIIDKILKERVKELSEKLDLDKDLLKELLVVIATPESISSPKFVGVYVNKVCKKLYLLVKENEIGITKVKTVKKLFRHLFGKDMLSDVALAILLEKKEHVRNYNESQQALWNLLTEFALTTLEGLEKSDIRRLLAQFAERRINDAKNQRDAARRIQFSSLSEEDYPNIYAAYKKAVEKDKLGQYL